MNASSGRRRRRHSAARAGQRAGGRTGDDQDLEVWPMRIRTRQSDGGNTAFVAPSPSSCASQSLAFWRNERVRRARVMRRARVAVACASFAAACVAQRRHQLEAGIGMEFLGRHHFGERGVQLPSTGRVPHPAFGQLHQMAPLIGSCSRTRKESINSILLLGCFQRHLVFPPKKIITDRQRFSCPI